MACRDVVYEVVTILDIATVDRNENVASLNARLGCAAVRGYDTDDHTVREPINATDCRGLSGLELNSDRATNNLMFRPDEHVVDVRDDVRRHGEAYTLRTHGLGIDGRVHANDLPSHVDQRTARVARVDGGIGLNK